MRGALAAIRQSGAGLFYIGGAFLALLAGLAVWATLAAAVPRAEVIVVTRDVPPGTAITTGDVQVRKVPAAAVPDGAFARARDVAGRRVRFGLTKGDMVRQAHLAAQAQTDVGEKLAQAGAEYRAVYLPAELVPAAERLMPGDHLSLIAVLPVQDDKRQTSVAISLGVASVLEVQRTKGPNDRPGILVAVTSQEVSRLALAMRTGSLTVAVLGDKHSPEPSPMSMEQLTGH